MSCSTSKLGSLSLQWGRPAVASARETILDAPPARFQRDALCKRLLDAVESLLRCLAVPDHNVGFELYALHRRR